MFWKKRIYLDSAAGMSGNPSSPHEEGRRAKKILEDARTTIARLVEVQSDDVLFTSGATESNALAILGHVRALRALAGADVPGRNNMHVFYLPTAHASIVENMKVLADEGVVTEALPIKEYRVDTVALAKLIRPETVLVSMDAVCGETGVVWNTREVADVLKKARGGKASARITMHVDASQAPWTEKITRDHFGADLITFDAAKVASLHGFGILIAHRTIPLAPLYKGGGQERGLRSGTEAPELAETFSEALLRVVMGREEFRSGAIINRELLVADLKKSIPGIEINEHRDANKQAPNILNLSLREYDTDYLVALLDESGFAVSTRSACETDSEEGSRAVFALTDEKKRAVSTLRISWSSGVTRRDLIRFAREFKRSMRLLDAHRER